MRYERRGALRIEVNLPARWEGAIEQSEATVTSLSVTGCFILSGGKVEPKELLRVEIYFPDDEPICAWGEVVDHAYEIGFALQFTLIEEDPSRLAAYIRRHS